LFEGYFTNKGKKKKIIHLYESLSIRNVEEWSEKEGNIVLNKSTLQVQVNALTLTL